MTKENNLQILFCGILFCISVAALVIACLAFAKKDCGKGEHYKDESSDQVVDKILFKCVRAAALAAAATAPPSIPPGNPPIASAKSWIAFQNALGCQGKIGCYQRQADGDLVPARTDTAPGGRWTKETCLNTQLLASGVWCPKGRRECNTSDPRLNCIIKAAATTVAKANTGTADYADCWFAFQQALRKSKCSISPSTLNCIIEAADAAYTAALSGAAAPASIWLTFREVLGYPGCSSFAPTP